MKDRAAAESPLYRISFSMLMVLIASALCMGIVFRSGLDRMVATWLDSEEYSFGMLIPLIAGFIVWQRKHEFERLIFSGAWSGLALVVLGAVLNLLGKLATVFVLQQYSMIVVVSGLIVCLGGWPMLKRLMVPVLLLLFMVPLPNFFTNNLSAQMRFWSSELGVLFLRSVGVSVFLEGNVIDLGIYKLQVADACSGLRYLFPLMTLGFIMAYFFKVAFWKRACIFLSTIPITIVLNSLRIAFIGVTVERWGTAAAEGFLHDFEGWVVFMLSAALLIVEMILLTKIGKDRRAWREVFGLELPPPTPRHASRQARTLPTPLLAAGLTLAIFAGGAAAMPQRAEAIPRRANFAEFPSQIDSWSGHREALESIYVSALQFDDYLLANFSRGSAGPINFYVAWYNSQSSGQSAHSPRSCMPAGGWRIKDLRTVMQPATSGLPAFAVNRALIESGNQRQIVYYWFQQRGRVITNEYMVKWYLFWDALTRNRTDGALIRLVLPLQPAMMEADADRTLTEFVRAIEPQLTRFVPN